MLNYVKRKVLCLASVMSAIGVNSTVAQTVVGPVHITEVASGWANDDVSLGTDGTFVNPANCPNHDFYISQQGQAGNRTHLAVALTAAANKVPVIIVVANSGCTTTGRPILWGVTLEE